MKQLYSVLMVLLFVASVTFVFLPGILWFRSPADFPWRNALTLALTAMAAERVWSMFFYMCQGHVSATGRDWTAVLIGFSYVAIWYVALLGFYSRLGAGVTPGLVWVGGSVYVAAVALRYWAFRCLRHRWAVHTLESAPSCLVTAGPYRYVRHPVYAGALLEVLCLPVMLAAWWALPIALIAFVPCEMRRAYLEEQVLRKVFGAEYDAYAARTWAFAPLWPKDVHGGNGLAPAGAGPVCREASGSPPIAEREVCAAVGSDARGDVGSARTALGADRIE